MASKRGPLSRAEVFYIQEHVKSGKNIDEIASDLDRPAKSIEKCVTQAQKANAPKRLTAGDQFARKSGSVVMTENAATIADARRKTRVPSDAKNCVTKVKNDQDNNSL
jgi:hypothetical protein